MCSFPLDITLVYSANSCSILPVLQTFQIPFSIALCYHIFIPNWSFCGLGGGGKSLLSFVFTVGIKGKCTLAHVSRRTNFEACIPYSNRLRFMYVLLQTALLKWLRILLFATWKQITAPGLVCTEACPGLYFLLPWIKTELQAHPSGFLFICFALVKQYSSFLGF